MATSPKGLIDARGLGAWLVFLLLGIQAMSAWSAVQAPGPESQTLAQMHHQAWTVRDGAPLGINDITRARDGYLWIGTNAGLYSFDGVSFKKAVLQGPPLVRQRILWTKAFDDGSLWLTYPFDGLTVVRNGVVTNYGVREGLPAAVVRGVTFDQDGTAWAATDAGVARLSGDRWEVVGAAWNVDVARYRRIFTDRDGTVWASAPESLAYLRKGARRFATVQGFTGTVNDFAQSSNGTIWLTTRERGVVAIDPRAAAAKQSVASIAVKASSLRSAPDNSLWIATVDQGLLRIHDPEERVSAPIQPSSTVERFGKAEGLSADFVFTLIADQEGNVWTGTATGIDRFRPSALTSVAVPTDAGGFAIVPGTTEGLFMSSIVPQYGPWLVKDGGLLPLPQGPESVYCAYQDPAEAIWLGAKNGLWRYDGGAFTRFSWPADLRPGPFDVRAITMDAQGDLWVSFARNGVYVWRNEVWSRPGSELGLPRGDVWALATDQSGRVWLGYPSNRIFIVGSTGSQQLEAKTGLDVGDVLTLYPKGERMWIGGQEGLQVAVETTVGPRLRLSDAALLQTVSGIVQTADGDLWLNQGGGAAHITAAELSRGMASTKGYAMKHRWLNHLDGLNDIPSEFVPLPTLVQGRDGKLYFQTRHGLLWLDPEHLQDEGAPPPVRVESMTVDGRRFDAPADVRLQPNTERVEIDYTALSLRIPERVRFRYRLVGFDRDWQTVGPRRQAFYSQLPPGSYRFEVAAANGDGAWNPQAATFEVRIPPAFIQSLPFKLLVGGALVAVLYAFYRARIRQVGKIARDRLYERLAERERIARDLHDTFFQGIQGLLLRFSTGAAQLAPEEPARKIFDEALRRSDDVMLEGRELLLDLRTRTKEGDDLPEAISLAGQELQKLYPGQFQLEVRGRVSPLKPEVFPEVVRLGREALTNAYRHSAAKVVEAKLQYGRSEFRLSVRDDGVGIPEDVWKAGFRAGHWGLPGMRERAARIHGDLDIKKPFAGGTQVDLRMDADQAYQRDRHPSLLTKLMRFCRSTPG